MDSDVSLKEVLEDLYTLLEGIETQNIALMQFLTDQKIAPEEKLRPYLERAGNASSVKWRAARARMNHLFAPAPKKATEAVSPQTPGGTRSKVSAATHLSASAEQDKKNSENQVRKKFDQQNQNQPVRGQPAANSEQPSHRQPAKSSQEDAVRPGGEKEKPSK